MGGISPSSPIAFWHTRAEVLSAGSGLNALSCDGEFGLGLECGIFMTYDHSRVTLIHDITQPSIPPGSVNEYQLRLGRQRQVWLMPIADERVGVQVKL